MDVIECVGLTKVYDWHVVALSDLTLGVAPGMAFGLLGENGAGKSTLVRLLMGFIHPTAGSLRVLGEAQVARAHPRIGYVHERPLFEPRFTGREYLAYCASLAGLWNAEREARIDAVLEQVGLREAARRRTGGYSKGMLQRLAIAQALLADPELLILDEVTSGLDPGSQWEVRSIITDLHHAGKTIFLCSHYLAEVEAICDTVGILRRGRLVRFGTVAELLRTGDSVEIELASDEPARDIAMRCGIAAHITEASGSRLRFAAEAQPAVLAALVAAGVPIRSLNPVSQTLEDVYVRATRASGEQTAMESKA